MSASNPIRDKKTKKIISYRHSNQPYNIQNCIQILDFYRYSRHVLISRKGKVYKLVPFLNTAHHAGFSQMPKRIDPLRRKSVNRFSIGVQLIGTDNSGFTQSQYIRLSGLIKQLNDKYDIKYIVGHDMISGSDIRQDYKIDPGKLFDWQRVNCYFKGIKKDGGKKMQDTIIAKVKPLKPTIINIQVTKTIKKVGFFEKIRKFFSGLFIKKGNK